MTIGLIGCGKMGSALTLGAIKKGVFESHQVLAYDPVPEAIAALGDGISAAESLEEAIHHLKNYSSSLSQLGSRLRLWSGVVIMKRGS
jgi:pyrroline-5-carboxylate reductase